MAYTQNVSAGMVVTGEVVDSGIQTIGSGGIASNAVVSGGSISIEKGGVVQGYTGYASGSEAIGVVASGGRLNNMTMNNGVISNAGTINSGTLNGSAFLQCTVGGSAFDIVIKDEARLEAAGAGCGLANITVDAAGQETVVGETKNAAQLIVFQSGCYVEGLTLKNGGSAHVYAQGAVYDVVVENGGVLYMTDWDFDTALDWQGLPRPQDGKVDGATVKSGGTLWIGGSSANVRNVTVEKGGYVTGFHVLATIRNLEVYNGSGYDTITYSNAVIKNFDLSGMNDGQGTILYDRGWVSNVTTTPTNITGLSIKQDVGLFTNINFYSTVKGTYTFADGSTKELDMSAGTINSFVLGSGMSLIGTMSKYTRSTGWDSLVINDLTILEGGILDGFATGRGNDGYSQIQKGTYVYADGTVRNWSFGGGTASGLVINSGCFVIQGPTVVSGVETETAGVTKDLYIDGGILVVAGSSVNDGITVVNDAALQVYGASTITNGVNLDFAEGDQFYNFSVVDGLATNLYITNGGFYYSSEGTTIENSIITGQRDTASGNADYANSVLWIADAGTARNVELQSGAVLKLTGNFTLDNVTIGEGVRIEWTTPTAGFTLIDTVLPGYENVKFEDGYLENWYVNGGTFTFQDQSQMKYKNIVIENLDYNGLKASGTIYVDGMVFDGGSSAFGNNFNANYGSVMKNVTWNGGWSDFKNDINGLFINVTNDTWGDGQYVAMGNVGTGEELVWTDITMQRAGALYIGDNGAAQSWERIRAGHVINLTVLADDDDSRSNAIYFRCGSIENLTMYEGRLYLGGGNAGQDAGGVWEFYGDIYLEGCILYNGEGYTLPMVLDNMDSFVLGGNTSINVNITEQSETAEKTAVIKGVGNNFYGVTLTASHIVLDQADSWFLTDSALTAGGYINIVSNLSALNATIDLTFQSRLGQGDYWLGDIGSTATAFDQTFIMKLGDQTFEMKIGDTMTVDGYTVKMEASFNEEWSVYIGFMSVRADASTNTEMVWNGTLSDAAMAIRYVNDLAAGDGQTINLGAAMENAGGNGVNYVGGVVATGA